jgi:hypothetical protein
MRTAHTAAVLAAFVAGLAACDSTSTRDMTAPEPGAVTHDLGALGTSSRHVVRRDGQVSAGPVQDFDLRGPGDVSSLVTTVTTECSGGVIDAEGFPVGGLAGGTYDEIEVPPGEICVLDGVTVIGSVRALAGARLFIFSSTIGADVLGLTASAVQLNSESSVGGNFDIQGGSDVLFASCAVDNSTITGNVRCVNHDPGSPVIRAELGPVTIGGNVDILSNVIPPGNVLLLQNASIGVNADVNRNTDGGFKSVNGNTVGNTLECKKNDAPFVGGPNVANKTKHQCF